MGRIALSVLALPIVAGLLHAQEVYRLPPKAVVDIVDAPPTPAAMPDAAGRRMLLVETPAMPPIAEVAEPILRLAGIRIVPRTNDRQGFGSVTGIVIRDLAGGGEKRVAFPANSILGFPRWSPDGERFAISREREDRIEIWVVEAATGEARALVTRPVNGVLGGGFAWMPDSKALLVQLVPEGRRPAPAAPAVPTGPRIEETSGRVSQVRTYQDLLETPHDEALFEHHATAQLGFVDVTGGKIREIGAPGIYASVDPSPNGELLLVTRIKKPFSRAVPYSSFTRSVEVWNLEGKAVHVVADLPVADEVPIEGVPVGPRSVNWRPLEDATLVWAEALDGGDPKKKVPHRDRILALAAPFRGEPAEIARVEHRYRGLDWLETKGRAFVHEYDRDRRWQRTTLLDADDRAFAPKVIWDRSIHDRYGDPGSPVRRRTPRGESLVRLEGTSIFLDGAGATPEGDRPFLDRHDLASGRTERLFLSPDGAYESFLSFVGEGTGVALTRFETPKDPPNYSLRDLAKGERRAITDFPDPAPEMTAGLHKELLRYERDDGVPLSGTLYIPPGYQKGQRLPLVVWAYPLEYTDPSTAGQVRSAPTRFTFFRGASQLLFVTQGYAVLDGAQLPIIGDPETVNDTFLKQLVAGAQAAIDAVVARGVADPERVGVGGHSYGAFMTANLLAHCDLFRAGIARSGAYNRTLTPFGFQSERRTLWEATETYVKVSPFMAAHRIDEPILLVHGEIDNNSGTFPIQSERLFHALKGHGATARLVFLPHESHGYRARESNLHVLAEVFDWFDRYVKNASPRGEATEAAGGAESRR